MSITTSETGNTTPVIECGTGENAAKKQVADRVSAICINCGRKIGDAAQKWCGKRDCEDRAVASSFQNR